MASLISLGRAVSPVAEKLRDIPLGVSALVLDTDVVLLSDPFKHLRLDADFEVCAFRHLRRGSRKPPSPQVMTDLFFPESQLLSTTLRPEDNINTGFADLLNGFNLSWASGTLMPRCEGLSQEQ